MNWSWKLGRLAGIDIYMHWTFLLLLGYVGISELSRNQNWLAAAQGVGLVLAVFVCIVLHELGHALTARRYHIQTRDITLLPIGGVARLERMPDDPRQELWVALAGPAVNVVIAAVLFAILAVFGAATQMPPSMLEANFLFALLVINIGLIVFNMLPAFPMDGGRVLRALLAHWISYGRATSIAAGVGQGMAVLFAVIGLFGLPGLVDRQPMMLLIAVFVFFGAAGEARNVRTRLLLAGVPVREAMDKAPLTVRPDSKMIHVADHLVTSQQRSFPVLNGGRLIGMLDRQEIMHALHQGQETSFVGDILANGVRANEHSSSPEDSSESVEDTEMLDAVLQRMSQRGVTSIPVTQEGQFVGLLTPESVSQFLTIRSAPGDRGVVKEEAVPG